MYIALTIGVALLLIYVIATYYLAKSIAHPKVVSLEQEIQWEKERQLWGNFDHYEKESYIVKGWEDYPLQVEFIKAATPSNRFIIITHGYTSNRYGAVKYLEVYRNLGFNTIIYDVRGHGANESTAVSLGNFESHDLLKLIEDTYRRYGAFIELGLHGESMGSSISLSVLKFHPKIKFVVADCGFSNLYDLIRELYAQRKALLLLGGVNLMMYFFQKFNMKETNPQAALKENDVPILLIHGKNDRFILPHHSERLAQSTRGYYELHLIAHATHAGSRQKIGLGAYTQLVEQFLARINSQTDYE
ncbi:MAG: alpha/beta hydrolase [Aerococcaceae bacterium]|nr:alpha/beta hydrolase [Aerococcaceae bacterium]